LLGPAEHPGLLLRLPEIEYVATIRLVEVVGVAYGLRPVAALAVCHAGNPSAGGAVAAIAEPDTSLACAPKRRKGTQLGGPTEIFIPQQKPDIQRSLDGLLSVRYDPVRLQTVMICRSSDLVAALRLSITGLGNNFSRSRSEP